MKDIDHILGNHYIMFPCSVYGSIGGAAMKVVFDVHQGRLAIEGDGPDLLKVLEAARNLAPNVSQIQIITSQTGAPEPGLSKSALSEARISTPPPRDGATGTLRQFARSLALDNIAERIAAIAYYVNKIEGRPSFAPKEMDGWFTMCGFQKPAQMPLALYDTKRKYGYAESVSRGSWRISNQGENLIIRKQEESRETQ